MRYRSQMRQALVAHLLLTGPALAADPIVGRASVTDGGGDGDTGVIRGTPHPPLDWRRAKRASGVETRPEMKKPPAAAPAPTQAACAIKGNISGKGDKIYHLPGTRDYDRTVITTSSGERMFCSEDEAKAAGWRAARS